MPAPASLWQRRPARRSGAGRGGARTPGYPRLLRPAPTRSARTSGPRRGPALPLAEGACPPSFLPSARGTNGRAGMVTFRTLKVSSMVPRPASPRSARPAHECSLHGPLTKLTLGSQALFLDNFLACCYSSDLTAGTTFYAQSEQSSYTRRKIL